MRKYAQGTEVPIDRSKTEIEKTLIRYGADEFVYGVKRGKAMIYFRANGRYLRFYLPMPDPESKEFSETPTGRERAIDSANKEYERELRRRWRALALSIKAKLESVQSGIMTFEQEFLSHIVLPDGKTIGESMIPQLNEIYATRKIPKMIEFFE